MSRTRRNKKGQAYEDLLERLDVARHNDFHLEASWIAYALVEDRLNAALELTGGMPPSTLMLGKKLKELRNRLSADSELRKATIAGKVLDEVEKWKDGRNPLMHSMAGEARPWPELQKEAEALSEGGRMVVRDVCSALMRLHKLKRG